MGMALMTMNEDRLSSWQFLDRGTVLAIPVVLLGSPDFYLCSWGVSRDPDRRLYRPLHW